MGGKIVENDDGGEGAGLCGVGALARASARNLTDLIVLNCNTGLGNTKQRPTIGLKTHILHVKIHAAFLPVLKCKMGRAGD